MSFQGLVVSDWEGIDRLCQPHGSNYRYCISAAINAGIDMVELVA
jgi:beta-glucosidase